MSDETRHDERDPAEAGRAMRALREMMRAFNVTTKQLERSHGVSGAQLEALEEIRATPDITPSDLALRSATDQSTASVVVKRLTEAGLVNRRHNGDRRRTHLTLTPRGETLLDQAPPSVPSRLRHAFMRMGSGDRTTLTQLLERWLTLAGLRRAA